MRRPRFPHWLLASLCATAVVLLACPVDSVSAEGDIGEAWNRARDAGSYRFSADVVQTTTPLPTATNVGWQSKQQKLHLEGHTDLPQQTLDLTLWSQGGSVLNARSGVEVRVRGDHALARKPGHPWEEVDEFTSLFAPDNDFMAYLAATHNVVEAGTETRSVPHAQSEVTFTRYTFDIDGPSFAAYMRDQIEQHLSEKGELPPGVELDSPRAYVEMEGEGELWVSEDGLPLRQILHLDFPEGMRDRVEADVDVTFSDYGESPPTNLARSLTSPQSLRQMGFLLATVVLLAVAVAYRRVRKVYAAAVLIVLVSMVFAPLVQNVQAGAFAESQAAKAKKQKQDAEADEAMQELQDELLASGSALPVSGPEALAMIRNDDRSDGDRDGLTDVEETLLGSDPHHREADDERSTWVGTAPRTETGIDSDQDGLTDYQEGLLGTDPNDPDTDGDLITDTVELEGFDYGGRTWYSDPLKLDTNDDGVDDGREWNQPGTVHATWDLDGDGVPDLFDRDDDDDLVPDQHDISPRQSTSSTITFDGDNPFSLVINGLTPQEPAYVEFQLRPKNPDHLWYAFNVLDWPEGDTEGNVQDWDGATFYDLDPSLSRSPNDNGDLKLVPMLEIRISGSTTNLPPTDVLEDRYGISVQPLQGDESETALYVPLQLTTDNKGGSRVAFHGKVLYLPEGGSWGNAHQVRLVWLVQALLDQCETRNDDGTCASFARENELQVIHTYDDEWYLTGFSVQENQGSDLAVIYEDPAVDPDLHDDNELMLLTYTLDRTFLGGRTGEDGQRDITVADLYHRLNHTTNSGVSLEERWGISNTLSVDLASYDHPDEAIYTLGVTTTVSILDNAFTPHWSSGDPISPTLLVVREDSARNNNLDMLDVDTSITWGGNGGRQLTVNMGSTEVQVMAGAKWTPYRYQGGAWEPYPISEYCEVLKDRYAGVFSEEPNPQVAKGKRVYLRLYYLGLYAGLTAVVEIGGLPIPNELAAPEMSADGNLASEIASEGAYAFNLLADWIYTLATARWGTQGATEVISGLGKLDQLLGSASTDPDGMSPSLLTAVQRLRNLEGLSRGAKMRVIAAGAAAITMVAMLVIGTGLIIASYFSESQAVRIAGTVLVGTALAVVQIVLPIVTVVRTVQAAVNGGKSALEATKGALAASTMTKTSAKVLGVIGLVISIGIVIGLFIYQVAQGGLNNIEIQQLIAQTIAAIIVAVIMFVVSTTVVGAIIVAVIALIDLILTLVGVDFTIVGFVTDIIAKALYGYAEIVETDVALGSLGLDLVNPMMGMVEGNQMVVTIPITDSVTHKDPSKEPRAWPYIPVLWTRGRLRDSTMDHKVQAITGTMSVDSGTMHDQWSVAFDHRFLASPMYRGEYQRTYQITPTLQAGTNITMPIFLITGYDIPMANCWMVPVPPLWYPVPVCYATWIDGSAAVDMGSDIKLDVLPGTLDEFYSLTWGDFDVQRDHDSDGLLAKAHGGNDPDDTTWDTDGDGLSDYYEVMRSGRGGADGGVRPLPVSFDTDGDGLDDGAEIRLGTFPNRRDSDGDGLDDGEEVFHFNASADEWEGGWNYVATTVVTLTGSVTETRVITALVTSDPLDNDTDDDKLNDLAERTLATHPRVRTPSPVNLVMTVSDDDGFVAPSQTFVYTATVENNIEHDPGLFVKGGLTVTLPGVLGGGVQTDTLNIYQGFSKDFPRPVTVTNSAPSGPAAIGNHVFVRMHDGDLNTYYEFDPVERRFTVEADGFNTYVGMDALKPLTAPAPYAVASREGSSWVYARTAGDVLSAPEDVRAETRCQPQASDDAPGIACNDSGTCLVTYGSVHYHNTTNVKLTKFRCEMQTDGAGEGDDVEPMFYFDGDRIGPSNYCLTCETNVLYTFSTDWQGYRSFTDTIDLTCKDYDVWSADDPINGTQTINYCPGGSGNVFFEDSERGNIRAWYYVDQTRWDGIYGRIVNSSGAPTGSRLTITGNGPERYRGHTAAASDGTDFLVVWQQQVSGPTNIALYARRVTDSGTMSPSIVRLDASSSDDTNPAVAWVGDRYLVVWQNAGNVYMAHVNASGGYVSGSRQAVANSASSETHPQVAYNPTTEQALVVYLKGSQVMGRFVQGLSVGSEFAIGYGVKPAVAYEPKFGGWLVSWYSYPNLHYMALEADGTPMQDKQGLGPGATHSDLHATLTDTSGVDAHDVACRYDTTDYGECGGVSSSIDTLYLDRLGLDDIPPWLGDIEVVTDTLVMIDADQPTSTVDSLVAGHYYPYTGTVVIGGTAADPGGEAASGVAGVEVRIHDGSSWTEWTDATGAEAWAFNWDVPTTDGAYTFQSRATDLVGNVETPSAGVTIYLDRTPPSATVSDPGTIRATQNQDGRYLVSLSGTVGDGSGSGTAAVQVLLSPHGDAWQEATLNGGNWSLDYVLPVFGSDGAALTDPTGVYTVAVRAIDALGNQSDPVTRNVYVDNSPPVAAVTNTGPSTTTITQTLAVSGLVTETGSVVAGIQGLEIAFTPAGEDPTGWQPVDTLDSPGAGVAASTWSHAVPANLEGTYTIDLRASDLVGNRNDDTSTWPQWQGEIDTFDPRVAITVTYRGAGSAAQTIYEGQAEDMSLTTAGFQFPCPLQWSDRTYLEGTWWNEALSGTMRLHRLSPSCVVNGFAASAPVVQACDEYAHCAIVTATLPVTYPASVVASAVLTPAHESALTTLDPISVTTGAYAVNGLRAVTVTVNGGLVSAHTWPCVPVTDTVTNTLWAATWAPTAEGRYTLESIAEDCTGALQSAPQPISVTVDTDPPSVALPTTVVTTSHRLSWGRVMLTGTASDTVGLEAVGVMSSPRGEAYFDGTGWRYAWYLGEEPDNKTYTVTVSATDAASHTTQVTRTITVDLAPPAPVTVSLAYIDGLGVLTPLAEGETIRDVLSPTLVITWTGSSDGSGLDDYLAGWTFAPTEDSSALTAYAPGGMRRHDQQVAEAHKLYAHVVAQDGVGNQQWHTMGPIYADTPATPDYVADPSYHGWMESGCTQMSADWEVHRNAPSGVTLDDVQRFYTSWDSDALRLTWTGANWNIHGDLFVYLDTQSGGTNTAYDPYGSGPAITLPAQDGSAMRADYLIMVEDEGTAHLMAWSGSAWSNTTALTETHFRLDISLDPVHTDILIPFDWVGIDPHTTSLTLVALASEEKALRIWAAAPDKNPLNSALVANPVAWDTLGEPFALTQQHVWPSLGDGVCPNDSSFVDADLHVSLTCEPLGVAAGFMEHDLPSLLTPGMRLDDDLDGQPDVDLPLDLDPALIGHGQAVTYTLTYTNEGSVLAAGAVVTVTQHGGVDLTGGSPQVFALTGVSGTIHIPATVNKFPSWTSAEVDAVVADSAHGPFDWLWVQHDVDTDPPQNLEILAPAAYANAYTNTVSGSVSDPSGVPTATLRVLDVPGGSTVATIACPDSTPFDGAWSCTWNAGGATDGTQFDLQVRAEDRFGNATAWTDLHRVEVDRTRPTVQLSADTLLALSDDVLVPDETSLTGVVLDDRQAAQVGVCAGPVGGPADDCALYDTTPLTTPLVGHWEAPLPILGEGDGEWQTLYFYALDAAGNRSAVTVSDTTRVDVTPPAVEVTTARDNAPQGLSLTLLEGTVTDGSGVATAAPDTRLYVAKPDGHVDWYPLSFSGSDWSFSAGFLDLGAYELGIEFRDSWGNLRTAGPFDLTVVESDLIVDLYVDLSASEDPAITSQLFWYDVEVSNRGPGIATTTTLTVTLPSVVEVNWHPPECSISGDDFVCNVTDVAEDGTEAFGFQVRAPLTTTGVLVCQAEAWSGKIEIAPEDNAPQPLYTDTAQPITGLSLTSDAPTVFSETTTLSATITTGTDVQYDWAWGDGDGVLAADPVMSHVYPAVGVYTAVVTASNFVNVVTATTIITTDIPIATPLLDEGFEDWVPPPGWLRNEEQEASWRWNPLQTHTGLYSAFYDDFFGQQDGWLVTPQVTPTLGSELVFWQYQNYAEHYGKHSIWISTGSNEPKDEDFVELTELGPGTEDTWEEVRLDLSAYAGQPIYVAFRYEGDFADEWYIDDVQVTVALVLAHDGPTRLGETTTMTASIATGTSIVYHWDFGDGHVGTGAVVTHTYAAGGAYTVTVTARNSVSSLVDTMVVPVGAVTYLPLIMRDYPPPCLDDYEPDDSVAQASTIATDGTAQSHTFHQAGDADWIAFTVVSDTVDYVIETFDLAGSDTVLYLYDSDGERLLDWNDDAGPGTLASRLDFNPYHAGVFYLQVVNYDPAVAGCDVRYSIRVTAQP